MTQIFLQAFIYLIAAVIAVPLAKRFGLGSVLGYLIAGVVIGPIVGLVGEETTTIQHFAEFGVVMMLFLVGLELEPKMLWAMRNRLLGLGGLQVAGTAGIIVAIAVYFGQVWTTALAIGLIFALSSTAIVLQTFNEKRLSKTEGVKTRFLCCCSKTSRSFRCWLSSHCSPCLNWSSKLSNPSNRPRSIMNS